MKIHQQPDAKAAHTQIGQHLCLVGRYQRGNRLDFKDNGDREKYIGTKAQRYPNALVKSRNANLAQQRNASLYKLKDQACGINCFQQFRPGLTMDLDGQSDDPFCPLSRFEHPIKRSNLDASAMAGTPG